MAFGTSVDDSIGQECFTTFNARQQRLIDFIDALLNGGRTNLWLQVRRYISKRRDAQLLRQRLELRGRRTSESRCCDNRMPSAIMLMAPMRAVPVRQRSSLRASGRKKTMAIEIKKGGSDGTRNRGLLRDRSATSWAYGP
jgi:hypothetical protein